MIWTWQSDIYRGGSLYMGGTCFLWNVSAVAGASSAVVYGITTSMLMTGVGR